MKKALLAILLVVLSMSTFAQERREGGRIVLRDGNSTVRISVNERDVNLLKRIRLLEEAVRDLQAQVYDLRDQPRTRVETLVVCVIKTTFDGNFVGKAKTQIEAEAIVRNACSQEAFGCSSKPVSCERQENEVIL